MQRITPLFFVLAAVVLVTGKQEEEKATLYAPGVSYVVPEERATLAKLQEINARFFVNRAGHITTVYTPGRGVGSTDLDLGFLAPLTELEELHMRRTILTPHGMDCLPSFKRLKSLSLSSFELGDEQIAVLGKLQQLSPIIVWRKQRQ